jgi:hypothetical protein
MFNTMMVKAKEELKQRHIQYLQQQEEEKRKQAELAEKRKKEEEERIKRDFPLIFEKKNCQSKKL